MRLRGHFMLWEGGVNYRMMSGGRNRPEKGPRHRLNTLLDLPRWLQFLGSRCSCLCSDRGGWGIHIGGSALQIRPTTFKEHFVNPRDCENLIVLFNLPSFLVGQHCHNERDYHSESSRNCGEIHFVAPTVGETSSKGDCLKKEDRSPRFTGESNFTTRSQRRPR